MDVAGLVWNLLLSSRSPSSRRSSRRRPDVTESSSTRDQKSLASRIICLGKKIERYSLILILASSVKDLSSFYYICSTTYCSSKYVPSHVVKFLPGGREVRIVPEGISKRYRNHRGHRAQQVGCSPRGSTYDSLFVRKCDGKPDGKKSAAGNLLPISDKFEMKGF